MSFDTSIILTLALCICTCIGNEIVKVRFGSSSSIVCDRGSSGGTYTWQINDVLVTQSTSGIDSSTINDNILTILSMTPQLQGTYSCRDDDDTIVNTFDVKVVRVANYSLCIHDQCPVNYNYNSGSSYTLNATLEFSNCGAGCLKENLVDPEWIVNPDPGVEEGLTIKNNSINQPGFNITTVSYQNSTINIAMVHITNASTKFWIKHLIHTNIDGQHGQQRSIIFNFNYTEGPTPTTTSTSSIKMSSTTTMSMPSTVDIAPSSTSIVASPNSSMLTTSISSSSQVTTSTPDGSAVPSNTSGTEGVTSKEDKDKNNSGVIIGVSIGVIVFIIIIVVVICLLVTWRYRYHGKSSRDNANISGANGSTRPKPSSLNCKHTTPLLQFSSINTLTTTPHTVDSCVNGPLPHPHQNLNPDDDKKHVDDDDSDVTDADLDKDGDVTDDDLDDPNAAPVEAV